MIRYINAKIIPMSDLADTYNVTYHSHYSWMDFNEIIFGSRFPEGIRYFYYGDDMPNEGDFSFNLCTLLRENFPMNEEIYIDTEV